MSVQVYLIYPFTQIGFFLEYIYLFDIENIMNIVHYDEVKDWQMTEMTLTCFNHPYSKEHIEDMISADSRLPDWGGELYAKEDDKVLGTVGMLYPHLKTKEGIEKVGGIRNVCTRPSAGRKGVSTKLFEEAHRRMKEKGVRYSFLMTDQYLVAYNLYKKLGYRNMMKYPAAYKKVDDVESDIEFKKERDPHYVRKTYKNSVKSLYGLVVRETDFMDMVDARGWPKNKNLKIAYEDGKRIGYALFSKSRDSMICNEIAVEDFNNLPKLVRALESRVKGEYMVFKFVNPHYVKPLKDMGYGYYDDRWSKIMVKDFQDDLENSLEKMGYPGKFHNGIYESY